MRENSTEDMSPADDLQTVNPTVLRNGSLPHAHGLLHPHQSKSSGNLASLVHHKWRKIWRRDSAEITPSDPSYKSVYLGNVVTTWAKGEGCLDRPASALWKNHCQGRGSVKMVISVAPSGLKAQTREHGLTEYWANRLTWCGVPPDYPKLFCWIYRHEGRKLKQELRCHAVLCTKESQAQRLSVCLKNRLAEALFDFKKEKILRQNARLSIVQSLYNTSAVKRRIVILNSNSQNYKQPLERSKSAPKLSCIEEFEEEEEVEQPFEQISEEPLTSELTERISPRVEAVSLEADKQTASISFNSSESSPPSISHRKSFPELVTHNPEGSRRPHTVPMDAKLNLPYMTGYDKVMQLLEMPAGETPQHLLDEDEDQFSFAGQNSDPVASSPGSDASESVVDSSCDDEGAQRLKRPSQKCIYESAEDKEFEINDNVSDESGYSEEAAIQTVVDRRVSPSLLTNNGSSNNNNNNSNAKGSPNLLKKANCSSTIIRSRPEPVKVKDGSLSSMLVVYDNLSFEI